MTNQNADATIYKALAVAAVLGIAGFLYFLRASGLSVAGLLVSLGMTLFFSAITVACAVMVFRSKEE